MDYQAILHRVDHTLLKPEATWPQVQALCDEAVEMKTASVCISPCFAAQARDYLAGRLPICTVIGFPSGAVTTRLKMLEAQDAMENGAAELDMVINIGFAKEGRWEALSSELRALREVTAGFVLKVIVEMCLLTREEKLRLCGLVAEAQADYMKTSTGFSTGGATVEDIRLMRENLPPFVKVKASGGIRSFQDGQVMLEAGADRLGASALVPLAKQEMGLR